ncbi:CapA family protein [Nitrosovibrio sp. Nv4]|uniref:CapA family protein n=1 Tax=Nitrosovibrio sp. Nv4 TaxID=1945880 RepID=UPI000BD0BDBE|nr:CapA family protein [Nitrosovibrio sp. Nv4]SOD40817.1 poly-gamma-glutamate synthesis protein (capsule biosynthesis protein) [Nitrosovibrio sp. Nv4]
MKHPHSAKHAYHRLERREFIVSAVATGFALALRPIWAQTTTHGAGVNIGTDETSARNDKQDAAGPQSQQAPGIVSLFLCGDVMTGRGIDQILPHPGSPVLFEGYMKNAIGYVELAEEVNGPIPKPVEFSYIWGDALAELDRRKPDIRIVNLETAVTRSNDAEDKAVNYRMHPGNIPCITAAKIDCCTLANNHVLDWGYPGLAETLKTLKQANIKTTGAGHNIQEARAPAVIAVSRKGRVLVFSFGSETSGIPWSWAAAPDRPGVNLLPDLSAGTIRDIGNSIEQVKLEGDIAIASIHWGSNWGYEVPRGQREFAHRLIDEANVDIVHGHSSHHVKGIEVYKGKLILHGCGDFLNDYEGISGHETYRGDLVLMYFVSTDPSSGNLISLDMTAMQIKHFRLYRASEEDARWLKNVLKREGEKFGTSVELGADNTLMLRWVV